MKAILILPLALLIGFAGGAQTGPAAAGRKLIRNNKLLDLAAHELTVKNLRQQYRKSLTVKSITPNIHDPAVKDTVLAANTSADELRIFTNPTNAFLVSGSFTSAKLSFGPGIRIGATQASFCKAYGQRPGFASYRILETPEGGSDITFEFKQGKLSKVVYRMLYID